MWIAGSPLGRCRHWIPARRSPLLVGSRISSAPASPGRALNRDGGSLRVIETLRLLGILITLRRVLLTLLRWLGIAGELLLRWLGIAGELLLSSHKVVELRLLGWRGPFRLETPILWRRALILFCLEGTEVRGSETKVEVEISLVSHRQLSIDWVKAILVMRMFPADGANKASRILQPSPTR